MECPNCHVPLNLIQAESAPVQPRPNIPSPPRPQPSPRHTTGSTDEVGELLGMVSGNGLNDWEAEFIMQTRERFKQYGDRIKMSDKQMNALRKIAGV